MAEDRIGMFANVSFELMPVVALSADFLALHANREQSFQALDAAQRRLQFLFLAREQRVVRRDHVSLPIALGDVTMEGLNHRLTV